MPLEVSLLRPRRALADGGTLPVRHRGGHKPSQPASVPSHGVHTAR